MAELNIWLFGYPAIELDEAPIAVDERKALALLAYLAVSGAPQSRETLGALLWPEHDQAQSYANLRHALWSLKRAGLATWLETTRETIALRDGFGLDVATFQRAIQDRRFDTAATLYRADFLAGFTLRDAPAFDEWQFFQAEQLRQALAAALQQLIAERRDRGDYEAGIAYARRWLALDPLHEQAHRHLMQLYTLSGQHAAALRQYQECARLLQEEVGSAPEDETTTLFEQIKARKLALPSLSPEQSRTAASGGNLPRQLTSFVGRQQEIAEVTRLLAISTSQLVTLIGSGGCGKTRLALQVGSELRAQYPEGVWFVDLAPLTDPALVPQTVAGTLGLHEEPGRPILATLIDCLRARKTVLILDNCEHVIHASAHLAVSLLRDCADVHILATSREMLGIAGETVFRVPSLSIPDPQQPPVAEALLQYEAVLLFVDRAAAVLSSFSVTGDNAAAIAQVCRRLDGIPLAIELAAARVQVLRVEQIAARLDDTFRLLTAGSRTAPPRQQTLRALIDWSYDLLSEPESRLLQRLSVFAGGWTLEAAETMCAGDAVDTYDVLDLLTQLANRSLVVADRELGVETRYRLLETIRQYARDKLLEMGGGEHVRDRHLAYFLTLAEQAEVELTGPRQVAWRRRLDDELDNIRTALEWALASNVPAGLRLASALDWEALGPLQEGTDWLAQVLAQPEAAARTTARAKGLTALGRLKKQSEFAQARGLTEEGVALYRTLDDQQGLASALLLLGDILCLQNDCEAGRVFAAEGLALYTTLGDKTGIAKALHYLFSWIDNKDYARTRAYLEESLALYRELGDVAGISGVLRDLGIIALRQGDFASARPWLEESLDMKRDLSVPVVAYGIQTLGELALRQGDYEQARAYLEESMSLWRERGFSLQSQWSVLHLGYLALRQGDLARARTLFVEGQRYFKDAGSKIGVIYALEGLASLLVAQGQPERALRIFAWADAMREAIDDARPRSEQVDIDRDLTVIHSQLDEATIDAAQAEGRAMTIEQAIAYALEA